MTINEINDWGGQFFMDGISVSPTLDYHCKKVSSFK